MFSTFTLKLKNLFLNCKNISILKSQENFFLAPNSKPLILGKHWAVEWFERLKKQRPFWESQQTQSPTARSTHDNPLESIRWSFPFNDSRINWGFSCILSGLKRGRLLLTYPLNGKRMTKARQGVVKNRVSILFNCFKRIWSWNWSINVQKVIMAAHIHPMLRFSSTSERKRAVTSLFSYLGSIQFCYKTTQCSSILRHNLLWSAYDRGDLKLMGLQFIHVTGGR